MTEPKRAEATLLDRLATHRRTRTERGASLGELGLLEEIREEVERLRKALDLAGPLAHPLYGCCDAMGEDGGCSECQRLAAIPETAPMRHSKSGGKYRVIGRAEVQASNGPVPEGAVMVIYEGHDWRWWAREEREFAERFSTEEEWRSCAALASPAAAEAGGE